MSRSTHGSKPTGFEYWSARPGNRYGGMHRTRTGNKDIKRQTHKAERVMRKALAEGWYG